MKKSVITHVNRGNKEMNDNIDPQPLVEEPTPDENKSGLMDRILKGPIGSRGARCGALIFPTMIAVLYLIGTESDSIIELNGYLFGSFFGIVLGIAAFISCLWFLVITFCGTLEGISHMAGDNFQFVILIVLCCVFPYLIILMFIIGIFSNDNG